MMLAFILRLMLLLSPRRDPERLALAVSDYVDAHAPLIVGDISRRRTSALIVAIAFRESGLDPDAIGDGGRSFCAMQINESAGGDLSLAINPYECVRRGAELVRFSFMACRDLPANERLAMYARGSCSSAAGRRISRDRFALAERIEREVKR